MITTTIAIIVFGVLINLFYFKYLRGTKNSFYYDLIMFIFVFAYSLYSFVIGLYLTACIGVMLSVSIFSDAVNDYKKYFL